LICKPDSDFYERMPDTEVLAQLDVKARSEREIQSEILHLLRQVERRRLYAERACGSTFECCVKHLKYSEGSASRRISAMRLLSDLPEPEKVEAQLKEGRTNMTALGQAQRFFKEEKFERGREHSSQDKAQLVERFLDQSGVERERILVQLAPDALPRERARQVSETHSELKLVLDQEAMEGLKRIGEIWSHALSAQGDSNPGHGAVIKRMIEFVLEKIEPKKSAARPEVLTQSFAGAAKRCDNHGRYVSRPVRRFVYERDEYRCTFIDPETGRRCESKHRLELDHVVPFARGGSNAPDNLRLACRAHNQRWAIRVFGRRSA
jgi:hypothetical protein